MRSKESKRKFWKFDLMLELQQHIDDVDFERVAKRINQLLKLDGSRIRVTKEQCEEYYRKNPPEKVLRKLHEQMGSEGAE